MVGHLHEDADEETQDLQQRTLYATAQNHVAFGCNLTVRTSWQG